MCHCPKCERKDCPCLTTHRLELLSDCWRWLSLLTTKAGYIEECVTMGEKDRKMADTSVIFSLMGKPLTDRNTIFAPCISILASRRALMWKKHHGESLEEHGSCNLCHELLPSSVPHDMARWQRASQSFCVSQIWGPEQDRVVWLGLEAKDGKIEAVFHL